MRPETIQVCNHLLCLLHNNTVCDVEYDRGNSSAVPFCLSQALFHLASDRASMLTVHCGPSLPILAKYVNVNAKCAQTGANYFVMLEASGFN